MPGPASGIWIITFKRCTGMVHRYPMDQDAYFAYNKKFLAPVLEVAEKYGTFLCVENTSAKNTGECYFPRTAKEMNDFVKFIDHPLPAAANGKIVRRITISDAPVSTRHLTGTANRIR